MKTPIEFYFDFSSPYGYFASERIDDLFKGAAGLFRELATPFYLAVTELEYGEWFVNQGRAEEAEPLLAEAREIFERLEAAPWLERLENVQTATRVPA